MTDCHKTDETSQYQPKFDADGLMPAMVIEEKSGAALMMAYVNQAAIDATLSSGYATFWSRSRQKYWQKGETSGNRLKIIDLLIDCDQDSLVMLVEMEGEKAACHTGRKSCYYRSLVKSNTSSENLELIFKDEKPLFDPAAVYKT